MVKPDTRKTVGVAPGSDNHKRRLSMQIAACDAEIVGLQCKIREFARASNEENHPNARRLLVRARDLRHKSCLLHDELRRIFPGSAGVSPENEELKDVEASADGLREVARKVLSSSRFHDPRQERAFAGAVADFLGPDPDRRRKALRLLKTTYRSPQIVYLLYSALAVCDDLMRLECIQALADLKPSCASPELEHFLDSSNPRLRLAALGALSELGEPFGRPACLGGLADRNAEVRKKAVSLLGSMEPFSAAVYLTVLLKDEEVEVRLTAARALRESRSGHAVAALIRSLKDPQIEVRREVLATLSANLSVPMNFDVNQDSDGLIRQVDEMLRWWSVIRVQGPPWSRRSRPNPLSRAAATVGHDVSALPGA
jgi:hypothetical protein